MSVKTWSFVGKVLTLLAALVGVIKLQGLFEHSLDIENVVSIYSMALFYMVAAAFYYLIFEHGKQRQEE